MESNIILPKTYIENLNKPLIFLAGPIRDAKDWQESAINYLMPFDREIVIANPRWDVSDRIRNLAMGGNRNHFDRQRAWERHYLDVASRTGAVLFWLENAPGLMTRLELGQLMTKYKYDSSTRFCVGSDRNFSDLDTIKYDLSKDASKKVYGSLRETCEGAIRLALKI